MPDARRIVVVGGGIAGLSAAYEALLRAREAGTPASVTLVERSSRFGGNLVTEREGGFVLDAGPDSWVVNKPQASALSRELGLERSLVGTHPNRRRYYVVWGDRLHAVPEGLVLGVPTRVGPLVRTRLFSWTGKLRMALEPLVKRRAFDGDDDESIGDFAKRRLRHEAAERLVAPLLSGISGGDASELSVRAAFPQLVAMEREHGSLIAGTLAARRAGHGGGAANGGAGGGAGRGSAARTALGSSGGREGSAFASLAGGVGVLVTALVDRLRSDGATLRTGVTVDGVTRQDGAWRLGLTGGTSIDADAVLLAVPGPDAARLLGGVGSDDLVRSLASIEYGSTATVFLGYRRADVAHPLDGVGFVVPRAAGRRILAGTWVSSKWDGRAPEGSVLLRVFFGETAGVDVRTATDEGLSVMARAELRSLMGLDAEPVLTRVFRFSQGTAQMKVGHLARMRAVREMLGRAAPGLRLAGGGYDGVGIPDCIRQGREAGRAMVDGR